MEPRPKKLLDRVRDGDSPEDFWESGMAIAYPNPLP
jgi:hypothetical protein